MLKGRKKIPVIKLLIFINILFMKNIIIFIIIIFNQTCFSQIGRNGNVRIDYVKTTFIDDKHNDVSFYYLLYKDSSFYWVDCSEFFDTLDSCYAEIPFKYNVKKDYVELIYYHEASNKIKNNIQYSFNKNDTILMVDEFSIGYQNEYLNGLSVYQNDTLIKINNESVEASIFNVYYKIMKNPFQYRERKTIIFEKKRFIMLNYIYERYSTSNDLLWRVCFDIINVSDIK
jgi:hypothetical protein